MAKPERWRLKTLDGRGSGAIVPMARPLIWWRVLLGFVVLAVLPPALAGILLMTGSLSAAGDFPGLVLMGLSWAVPTTVVAGPPLLALYRWRRWERPAAFAAAGALVGLLAPVVIVRVDPWAAFLPGPSAFWGLTIPTCAIAAIVFRHVLYAGLSPQTDRRP